MGDEDLLPFPERVKLLAKERGLSVERVAHDAWDPNVRGTSPNFLKKVMRGERRATMSLYEAVAAALGVTARVFPEYRLAAARRLFDEDAQGLDEALENLSLLAAALPAAVAELSAPAAEHSSPQGAPASPALPGTRAKGSGR